MGGGEVTVPMDDSDIEVVYPDEDPGAETIQLREPGKLTSPRQSQQLQQSPRLQEVAPVPLPAASNSGTSTISPRLPMVPAESRQGGRE